jgi:hypothetical protein
MNKQTLDTAVRVGQMLKLMAPLAAANKTFAKRHSKLRAALDEQVVLCILAPESEQGAHAPGAIVEFDKVLRDSMLERLNVQGLIKNSGLAPTIAFNAARKDRISDVHQVLAPVEAVSYETSQKLKLDQARRSKIIREFTSVVKNTNWLGVLMHVGLTAPMATQQSMGLTRTHSSEQGRELLAMKLAQLCPTYFEENAVAARRTRSKTTAAPAVKADGFYTTHVTLSVNALLAQSDIAALVGVAPVSTQSTLEGLLKKAAEPVVVAAGVSPEAAAQRVIDELVAGLVARNKAIETEKRALRKRAEESAKASAVDALKQLSPQLLKVLKDNPDLLKSV